MSFTPNKERPDIMEFLSTGCKVYLNETADHVLLASPIGLNSSNLTLTFNDEFGNKRVLKNVKSVFIEGGIKLDN